MTNKTIKIDFKQTIITQATTLAERHASYVDQFVSRANVELYAILAEIMALYEQVQASPERSKVIKHIRQHLRDNLSIKTQANTKTTALVTKLVTQASRKTAHVYSRVLEAAEANGIGSAGLADWIASQGGIDKVRMAVHSKETVAEQKAFIKNMHKALRHQLTTQSAVGQVNFSCSNNLPGACDVAFTHVLCRFNDTTEQYEIVSVMYPSSTLEAKALGEHMIMLGAAAVSDQDQRFHAYCKEYGLNMDMIFRWMHSNGIADASAARALGRSCQT